MALDAHHLNEQCNMQENCPPQPAACLPKPACAGPDPGSLAPATPLALLPTPPNIHDTVWDGASPLQASHPTPVPNRTREQACCATHAPQADQERLQHVVADDGRQPCLNMPIGVSPIPLDRVGQRHGLAASTVAGSYHTLARSCQPQLVNNERCDMDYHINSSSSSSARDAPGSKACNPWDCMSGLDGQPFGNGTETSHSSAVASALSLTPAMDRPVPRVLQLLLRPQDNAGSAHQLAAASNQVNVKEHKALSGPSGGPENAIKNKSSDDRACDKDGSVANHAPSAAEQLDLIGQRQEGVGQLDTAFAACIPTSEHRHFADDSKLTAASVSCDGFMDESRTPAPISASPIILRHPRPVSALHVQQAEPGQVGLPA